MPRKLGQHFLADPRVKQRIVDALRLTRDDLVVEIGAGRGAMTGLLAERAGRVVAIEIDPELAAGLREESLERVEVVEGDILTVPLAYPRMRIFGNLPYYITSPILMRLFEHSSQIDEIVVMVQREVAERIAAVPGTRDYGLLSVTAQYYTRPQMLFRIPPGAFRPPPRVDSALVRMTVGKRVPVDDEGGFFRLARAAFQHKRKTLVNNLKSAYGTERASAALLKCGLALKVRAEELRVEDFAVLASALRT